MRSILMFVLSLALLGCQATPSHTEQDKELLGVVSPQELLQANSGFAQSYHSYQPSENELAAVKLLEGKSLTILFGTWCHDSEREVPRLLKTLDMSQGQLTELRLIAVNHNKQEPSGIYQTLELRYTPTFVLFDGTKELGRVVERPQLTLTEDLAALLN
jgi:hypothetical protein